MYAILFLFFFKWILVVHQLSMVCFNVLRGIALIGHAYWQNLDFLDKITCFVVMSEGAFEIPGQSTELMSSG